MSEYWKSTGPPYQAANEGKPIPNNAGSKMCAYAYDVAVIRELQRSKGIITEPIAVFNYSLEEEKAFLKDVTKK